MATEIGFIKGLIGLAIATAADGSQRTLQVGDKVFANEIVSTGAAGAVEIEFTDGSIMDLGRNSQAILDNEVLDPQQTAPAQTAVQDDVDALQQALLDGADPTQVGEATAAGAGTQSGNEGHTPVTVQYLAPQAPVTSGFDTTGPSLVLPEIINEIYDDLLNEDNEAVFDDVPVANDDGFPGSLGESNTLFEDRSDFYSTAGTGLGFVNGRADFTEQTTTGNILANDSFGANGPGGLVSVTYTGTSSGVTSGGVATLEMADPDSPGTGPVWTLTVEPNGDYTFTLHKPYVHSGEGEDIAQELFEYTIQDADGDTASATLTFNIVDDVPHIDNDSQQIPTAFVDEDDVLANGNADSSIILPINFGADGAAAINPVILSAAGIVDQNGEPLTSNGVELTYNWDAATGILTGSVGNTPILTMTVEHDANADTYGVQVSLLGNLDHPDETSEDNLIINVGYTATDGDGDAVDGAFAVNINDDVPEIDNGSQQIPTAFVDEDDVLADGKDDASIILPINFGADGAAAINPVVLSAAGIVDQNGDPLTSNGVELTYSWDAATGILTGSVGNTPILTMTVEHDANADTYGVQVSLLGNLDHPDETSEDNLIINVGYTATDGDGDAVDGAFAVNINDDVPEITSQPIQILQESFEDVSANQNGWGVQGWGVKGEGGATLVGDHGAIWTVNVAGIEIQSGSVGGSTASDGNQHAELDTHNFQNNGAGDTTLTVLSTTVNLPYAEASLSFDYKPRPDDKAGSDMKVTLGEGNSAITVILDAQANGTVNIVADNGVTVTQVTNPSTGWITITLNYSGLTLGAASLSFAGLPDADGNSNSLGAYIDNINMTASIGLQVDESNLNVDATTDFSSFFTSSFGEDGAGSITYTLNSNQGSTGIKDTATGDEVMLRPIGTDGLGIEGYVVENGQDVVVFNLTVDAEGKVTLDQQRAVIHADPSNNDDTVSLSLNSGLINLVGKITDADGDEATAELDLTSVISFRDDGPSITATQPAGPTLPTYEFTITNHDEVSSAALHNSYGYYIKDSDGNPTNGVVVWDDVHDKDTSPVTVTGYTPDQIGFFIIPNGDINPSIQDNTSVTFSLVNGQWKVFTGTTPLNGNGISAWFDDASFNKNSELHVVDNEFTGNQNWEDLGLPGGDRDYNDININVEWKITNGSGKLLTVDETALAYGDDATTASAIVALAGSFAITAGADGLGSIGYELGLVAQDADSGLVDTGSNNAVLLRTNAAGDVEGYVADGVVFTLTVNTATGEVTLTQLRAVVHGNPADSDESTTPATINDGLITLTATVTDGDGDTASDSIDLGTLIAFEDDGPTAVADNTIITNEDTPIVINVLANDNLGADNATVTNHTQATNGTVVLNDDGTFTYTPSANYSGADSFSYTLKDGDGDTSTALVSIGVTPVADAPTLLMSVDDGTAIVIGNNFVINGSFEDVSGKNANGGKVTDQPIADGGLVSRISIPGWTTVSGPAMEPHDQNHAGVGTTDGVHYMDLGGSPGNTSIEQKFSSLVVGQTYQLSFDFRDKAAMQESGQAGQDSGVMNVVWNGAVIATVQGNNTDDWDTLTINVEATGNDSLVFAEVGDSDDNWGIALDNVQLHGVAYNYELSVFGTLTDVDGSESLSGVTITNLPDGAIITSALNADGTYDSGTLTITSDHQLSATEVNTITGQITSTDGASTATTVETAKVVFDGLDATGETADLLIKGDGGANNIIGGAGDDIIFGGAGNDILTGGAGSDTFVWNQADLGTAGTAAMDTVTDFDVNHDVLNLSDLLSDASHTIEGISTGTDNHLQLNINDTSGNTVQQIDLQGVSAGTDVNSTLNSLIASGAINDGI